MKTYRFLYPAIGLSLLGSGCVHTKPLHDLVNTAKVIAKPEKVNYQMQDSLADFGAMVRAYTCHLDPIVIEVDMLPNDSGISKELPREASIYVVNALQAMGLPFVVTRPVGGQSIMDNPGSASLYNKPPDRPLAMLRVRGELTRNSDRVVREKELRASVSGKINGGDLDADAGVAGTATVRNFRIALYLEDASGKSVPGNIANFEVWHRSDEATANASLYFQGSGGGYNSKVQINQDAGDAALDASAAAMIYLLGNYLELPYWRTNAIFSEDHDLETTERRSIVGMTQGELEVLGKKYLFGEGKNFNVTLPGISGEERQRLQAEMRRSRYQPGRREDIENFLVGLWQNLDYRAAATRLENLSAVMTRTAQEEREASGALVPASASAHTPTPATAAAPLPEPAPEASMEEPHGPNVVLISIGRLTASAQAALMDALKKVPAYKDLHLRTDAAVCELSYDGDPVALQAALRGTPELAGLDYYWQDLGWRSMDVVPL